MDYNDKPFKTSNYDYEKFPGPKAAEKMLDFKLHNMEGDEISLGDYAGQWIVLETGSLLSLIHI